MSKPKHGSAAIDETARAILQLRSYFFGQNIKEMDLASIAYGIYQLANNPKLSRGGQSAYNNLSLKALRDLREFNDAEKAKLDKAIEKCVKQSAGGRLGAERARSR